MNEIFFYYLMLQEKVKDLQNYISGHVNPFSHNVHFWYVIGASIVVAFLFLFIYRKKSLSPEKGFIGRITHVLEVVIIFIRNQISIENLGEKDGKKWTGFFCSLFFFVLTMNLLGIIPAGASATGNPFVTGGLALITFFVMTFVTIAKTGLKGWFGAFIPSGVPKPILFILVPIELLGVVIKCVALMIRLFANMFAGHIVLFSILGIVYVLGWVGVPALAMGIPVYALEVFVAFLQAYIFTFLSAMFIGQMFHPDH